MLDNMRINPYHFMLSNEETIKMKLKKLPWSTGDDSVLVAYTNVGKFSINGLGEEFNLFVTDPISNCENDEGLYKSLGEALKRAKKLYKKRVMENFTLK